MTNVLSLRTLRRLIPEPVRPSKPWPLLPGATRPEETQVRMRAQSLLTGELIGGACPPLTYEQACDVLRWAGEK
jgi:hypothetical protein